MSNTSVPSNFINSSTVNNSTLSKIITVNNSFTLGQVVYYDGSNYQLAKADLANTLGLWIVGPNTTSTSLELIQSGYITGLTGLTTGNYYYLSNSSSGVLTSTEPVTGYSNPLFFADSTVSGWVLPYRPVTLSTINYNGWGNPTFYAYANNNTVLTDGTAAFCNTSAGAFTLYLPTNNISLGSKVRIIDYYNYFSTNNLTINPNGANINSVSGTTFICDLSNYEWIFEYINSSIGWSVIQFGLADTGIIPATSAECIIGTDNSKYITPLTLKTVEDNRTVNENIIINPNFLIGQRQAGITGVGTGAYVADRWKLYKVGTSVHNTTISTSILPAVSICNTYISSSMGITVTTAEASLAVNSYISLYYNIEGYDYAI